jgi:hypothetical protein
MKMNAAVKAKWLEALRSGRFPQTHGTLRDKVGYCCLGVLTELAQNEGVCKMKSLDGEHHEYLPVDSDPGLYGETAGLLGVVQDWAGIRNSTAPELDYAKYGVSSVIGLNDELRLTFAQIADVIEYEF